MSSDSAGIKRVSPVKDGTEGRKRPRADAGRCSGLKLPQPVGPSMHYKCAGCDHARGLGVSDVLNLFIDLS